MKKQFAIKLTNQLATVKTAIAKAESTNKLNFSDAVCCKVYEGFFKKVDREPVFTL